MKAATIHEIKEELAAVPIKEMMELCLRLARFKKENKELITYLLFESADEQSYIKGIIKEIDEQFHTINTSQLYFAKKSLRKIVRIITKYARYSDAKGTELELRIYFCQKLKESDIPFQQNTVISNLYQSQLKKIRSIIDSLHEDLQYDYLRNLKGLENQSNKP